MDGNGCTQYLPLNAKELSCPIQTWVSQQFVNRSQLSPFTAGQSPFISMIGGDHLNFGVISMAEWLSTLGSNSAEGSGSIPVKRGGCGRVVSMFGS